MPRTKFVADKGFEDKCGRGIETTRFASQSDSNDRLKHMSPKEFALAGLEVPNGSKAGRITQVVVLVCTLCGGLGI